MKLKHYGLLTGQVLNLLANEFALRFVRDREERRKLHKESDKAWMAIDRKQLYRILDRLRLGGYIDVQKGNNNQEQVILNSKGRSKAMYIAFRNMKLEKKPQKWDKKWRMVLFDIPESRKRVRDALRQKLRLLGFIEFQKSVFAYPYPCRAEINFVLNYFDVHNHVYYIDSEISPDNKLRSHFKLN